MSKTYRPDFGQHLDRGFASHFERQTPSHAAESNGSVRRGGRRGTYLSRDKSSALTDPLLFEHEKRHTKLLPLWDEGGNREKALRALRRQNRSEHKCGITEYVHQDVRRYDKACGGHVEPRFEVAARPAGFIGLSADDCFVRTVPHAEVVAAVAAAAAASDVAPPAPAVVVAEPATAEGKLAPVEPARNENCVVETPSGLDLAAVSESGRERVVYFCRVLVAAGTAPDAIAEFFRSRVQAAQHSAIGVAAPTAERVACDVRFEPCSGYAAAPVGSSMQLIVRLRTWRAAGEQILKGSIAAARAWHTVKYGGRLQLTDVWTLEEYKAAMHHSSVVAAGASDSSSLSGAPVLEYTMLVRGADSSLASVLDQCRRVRDHGFINFTSLYAFGQPLELGSLRFARAFLRGDFTNALLAHASLLARTSAAPCAAVVDKLRGRLAAIADDESCRSASGSAGGDPVSVIQRKNLRFEWNTAQQAVEAALDEERHQCRTAKATAADVNLDALQRLHELLQHVASADGDCRAVLRDGVVLPRAVVQWHLKSLSDLHWNTLASIRVRRYGATRVVPGDLVFDDGSSSPASALAMESLDYSPLAVQPAFGTPSCVCFTFDRRQEHPAKWWAQEQQEQQQQQQLLRVVSSEADAARLDVRQVVLPRWGWWDGGDSPSEQQPAAAPFPAAPGIDRAAFEAVSELLNLPPAAPYLPAAPPAMQLFPPARGYYRALVVKPLWMDAHCWDARVGIQLQLESRSRGAQRGPNHPLPFSVEEDGEGLRRLVIGGVTRAALPSPSDSLLPPVRPVLRHGGAGRAALMATIPAAGGGITTAVRIALPATAAITSALREVFRLDVVQPADISRLMHMTVQESWRHQSSKLARIDRHKRSRASAEGVDL